MDSYGHMACSEKENSDSELVAEILADRDRQAVERAYRTLVERYWKVVTILLKARLSSSGNVEDIAQEAFIRAWRALPKLENPKLFLGWLLRIAQNLATDYLRRRHKEFSLDSIEDGGKLGASWNANDPSDVHAKLEKKEELELVNDALQRLAEPYRTAIILRYMKSMSNKEMACSLGEPEGTIRNRVFRALGKLRKMIETQKVSLDKL